MLENDPIEENTLEIGCGKEGLSRTVIDDSICSD
jgi:hypothetical protein